MSAVLRVVIAPDSFKGTAGAVDVAAAVRAGWLEVRPGDDVLCAPMADGGEGTIDAFATAVPGARRHPVRVTGPHGEPVETEWLEFAGRDGRRTGVVELAATSGLTLSAELRPLIAQTTGFGEAIAAALDAGVDHLVLAIGGSASSDGGAGLLCALGARLLDAAGASVGPGNAGLADVAVVDLSGLRALPPGGAIVITDVSNPLLGADGAVAVFGRQKGIGPADAPGAEGRLSSFARLLSDRTGIDPASPGAGSAGGAGFGLLAWGAVLCPGAQAVAEAIDLPSLLRGADLVITGEGRFDAQSECDKVPSHVRVAAESAGAHSALIAGSITAPAGRFGSAVSLTDLAGGSDSALANPLRWLRAAGRRLATDA